MSDCRGRSGCSWPGLIEAYRDRLPVAAGWTPVTLLEGMAAVRPVAATAVDGIRTVSIPDETALLVPPANPTALAQACVRLGNDPQLRRRMGQAGRARVVERYSIDAMINNIARLYTDLLQARGLGRLVPGGAS